MQAPLQGIDADGGVIVMWRRNEHRVGGARADQFLAARETPRLGEPREFFRGGIAYGRDLAPADLAGHDLLGMTRAHVADANDSQSDGVHFTRSFKVQASY